MTANSLTFELAVTEVAVTVPVEVEAPVENPVVNVPVNLPKLAATELASVTVAAVAPGGESQAVDRNEIVRVERSK